MSPSGSGAWRPPRRERGQAGACPAERDDVAGPRLSRTRARFMPRQRPRSEDSSGCRSRDPARAPRRPRKRSQRRQQAGDVILVRMGEHHHVEPSLPEGELLAQPPQGQIRVRAAVDQRSPARRRNDEDRVALADVQRDQVQPPIGSGQEGQRPMQRQRGDADSGSGRRYVSRSRQRTAPQRVGRPLPGAAPTMRCRATIRAGYQAAASQPGAARSTDASGTAAVAWPARHHQAQVRAMRRRRPPTPRGRRRRGKERLLRPTNAASALGQHHQRDEWHDQHVGEWRDQREALEVEQDDWQGRHLGGHGQRHRLADHRRPALRGEPRRPAPNQIRPAVARAESWKPTSHTTLGAASTISSAASMRADMACERDPPSRQAAAPGHQGRAHDRRRRSGQQDVARHRAERQASAASISPRPGGGQGSCGRWRPARRRWRCSSRRWPPRGSGRPGRTHR